MFAAAKGHVGIVRFLLGYGADVNMTNRDGWSALMIAADWGHMDIVELLVSDRTRFDPATTPFGRMNLRMALIVAFMKKYYEIFNLLLHTASTH